MKKKILLSLFVLGSLGTATLQAQTAAKDSTMAVKIAVKADKLLDKGKEDEALALYEQAGELGLHSAQTFLVNAYAELKQIDKVLYWMNKLAAANDPEFLYALGDYYETGFEFEGKTYILPDLTKALEYYEKAAELKYPEALSSLGDLYSDDYEGNGPDTDLWKAALYYHKAATLGDAYSQRRLAMMLKEGRGVQKDLAKSFRMMQMAAKNGEPAAMLNLGMAYHLGEGTAQDYDQALIWYTKASECSDADVAATAKNNLAILHETTSNGHVTAETVEMYRQGAALGQDISQFNLGLCYFQGAGIKQDYDKAAYWFLQAAEQHYQPAQIYLARCYINGLGVSCNDNEAIRLLAEPCEKEDTTALQYMYHLYIQKENYEEAFKYAKRGADLGSAMLMGNVSWLYLNGKGVDLNGSQAYKYAKEAARHGDYVGISNLAICYENGYGVDKNNEQAVTCYQKAYEKAPKEAKSEAAEKCGLCYMRQEKYEDALRWFKLSSTPVAYYHIGWIYGSGKGVPEDKALALEYFKKAAAQTTNDELHQKAESAIKMLEK